ncbi:MAG: tRNA (adenosine(37)-N6)-dimethylallyltransferase MiaA [Rhodospirillales bacterium]|nr:tRNA (adenosine(37)-N6)-dimethylallyltransferase MiaA [Rhodospirillales bacterium]
MGSSRSPSTDRAAPGLCLVVAGPTASGKSRLAVDAAEAFGGVVINADSLQVYRELRILTARPTPADEARVPHRLFGVLSAAERCSAGRWRELALAEINAAWSEKRLPIIVGGTGLYLEALLKGLAPIPDISPEATRAAEARLTELGGETFKAELVARDPSTSRIRPSDRQRLVRAAAVLDATGRPLSEWQAKGRGEAAGARFATILLAPPREQLASAIEGRFTGMVAQGALDEVRAFRSLGLDAGLPAAKALGLRELGGHLDGTASLDEACRQATAASRRYAKRQMTWFRHRLTDPAVFSAQYSESLTEQIFSFIRRFLLTEPK